MKMYQLAYLFLAGVVLTGSCQKGQGKVEENFSVTPPSMEVEKELSSYSLEVSSNVSWSVVLEGEGGASVSWATLGRNSGRGNAQLQIRVLENKYKEPREANIVFTTEGNKNYIVKLIQKGDESSQDEGGSVTLRIGTYNLRTSNSDIGTVNDWSTRKERLKKSFIDCDFDIVGLQELQADQQAWLRSELGDMYDFHFFSPYSPTGAEGTKGAQGIGYRKGKITLSDWHYFWASDNPEVMTEADVSPETGTGYNRGGCCGVFTHTATGVQMLVMNNHGCLFDGPNAKYAHVYVDKEKAYNSAGLPSFFIGDMNETPNSTEGSPYMTYTSYWKDAFNEVEASERTGPMATYNGFNAPSGKTREDYVFFRSGKITVNHYTCNNTLYDGGKYASDHFPVYVDVTVSK